MEVGTTNMKMEILRKENKLIGTTRTTPRKYKTKKGFCEIYEDRKGTGTRSDANVY